MVMIFIDNLICKAMFVVIAVFLIVIDDDAYSSDSVPAVAFVDKEKFEGNVTIDSSRSTTEQISPALDLATHVDALESKATVTLTGSLTNYSVGSSSNYEIVFCDATQLPASKLMLQNVTGYGILVVRENVKFGGNTSWHGLIIVSKDIEFGGGGSGEIYGSVLAGGKMKIRGTIEVYYNSSEIDKAKGSIRDDIFRWEDKNLN